MKTTASFIFLVLTSLSAFAQKVNHTQFDELLGRYVSDEGNVKYEEFKESEAQLDEYLKMLESNHPEDSWSQSEKMVYWINAYNAYTIKLIFNHYPVNSIKDIKKPWGTKFITIEGKEYSLNNIEHDILRKMGDPRIHFAINCASYSCPRLHNEAFTTDNLENNLESLAEGFINDPKRNKISKDKAELSEIFNWFKGDFTKNGSLIDFINKYSSVKVDKGAKVSHLDYNWNLNK